MSTFWLGIVVNLSKDIALIELLTTQRHLNPAPKLAKNPIKTVFANASLAFRTFRYQDGKNSSDHKPLDSSHSRLKIFD